MNDQIVTLEEQAVQAVREAGALLADPAAVRSIRAKSKTDYVTNVDVAVQEFLRERLAAVAPDIQFMGEEQDNRPLDWSRPCWILDPVDGTTNLIHRFRHSAVSLALAEGGQIRLGVVYNPYSGECFTARRGLGAFCNGSPIRVSGTDRLGTASSRWGQSRAAGSWPTRRFARCGTCTTPARTSGGQAVPAWICAGWPAAAWRAMWSLYSSRGITPLECSLWRRPGDRLPLLAAPPSLWRRVGLCWPPMGGSTAHCKQF